MTAKTQTELPQAGTYHGHDATGMGDGTLLRVGETPDQLQAAYDDACRRHPEFPDAMDSMGTILAEEILEVVQAGLRALQAINDHRDEGRPLADVVTEIRHVNAVSRRALERLDGAKG